MQTRFHTLLCGMVLVCASTIARAAEMPHTLVLNAGAVRADVSLKEMLPAVSLTASPFNGVVFKSDTKATPWAATATNTTVLEMNVRHRDRDATFSAKGVHQIEFGTHTPQHSTTTEMRAAMQRGPWSIEGTYQTAWNASGIQTAETLRVSMRRSMPGATMSLEATAGQGPAPSFMLQLKLNLP